MRYWFDERSEAFKLMQKNSEHLTYSQMNSILDSMQDDWLDLTFVFTKTSSGFNTTVQDNKLGKTISLNKLSVIAYDYYMKKLNELSLERMKNDENIIDEQIKKIRQILYSNHDDNEGLNVYDRQRKIDTFHYPTSQRVTTIAQ